LQDEGDKTLTLQKMDAGEANIVNNEGVINLKPSNDLDDFICFLTSSDLLGFYWDGVLAYTVVIIDNQECRQLMKTFIKNNPELWNEGVKKINVAVGI
jgi:hypothetical protein